MFHIPTTLRFLAQVGAELFHLSSDFANTSLGGLTIVCALVGILGGGELLLWLLQIGWVT